MHERCLLARSTTRTTSREAWRECQKFRAWSKSLEQTGKSLSSSCDLADGWTVSPRARAIHNLARSTPLPGATDRGSGEEGLGLHAMWRSARTSSPTLTLSRAVPLRPSGMTSTEVLPSTTAGLPCSSVLSSSPFSDIFVQQLRNLSYPNSLAYHVPLDTTSNRCTLDRAGSA